MRVPFVRRSSLIQAMHSAITSGRICFGQLLLPEWLTRLLRKLASHLIFWGIPASRQPAGTIFSLTPREHIRGCRHRFWKDVPLRYAGFRNSAPSGRHRVRSLTRRTVSKSCGRAKNIVSKWLRKSVQFIANFNDLHFTQTIVLLAGTSSHSDRSHVNCKAMPLLMEHKILLLLFYSVCCHANMLATKTWRGCQDVPQPPRRSGCKALQAVDTRGWKAGADIDAQRCRSWGRFLSSHLAAALSLHIRITQMMATPSTAISTKPCHQSPTMRLPCFGPSFLKKSGPSSMTMIREARLE